MKSDEQIKSKIVHAYRRGVCDSEGRTIPQEHRGPNWKGSAFRPPVSEKYRENYDKIDWSAK